MCNFLSACICRDGRLVCDGIHGHTELARRYIGGENGIGAQRFWEFELPPAKWLPTTTAIEALRNFMEPPPNRVVEIATSLIAELATLNGISRMLPWLAVLRHGRHEFMPSDVRIIVLLDTATLDVVDGSQCVIYMFGSSRVGKISGSSQVTKMFGSSQVGEMCEYSRIDQMFDSSRVGKTVGSSQVGEMCEYSRIDQMFDSSRVGKTVGSSQVGEMCEYSRIDQMFDYSHVGKMLGSSKVGKMFGYSQVNQIFDSSRVEVSLAGNAETGAVSR